MRRLAITAAALLAVVAGGAHAVTNTYSTGTIDDPIGQSFDRSLTVPDPGPVSFVRVSFRITTPDTSALAISLVSPRGTEVPLVTNRGAAADFGSDSKGCGGLLTVVDSDETTNPISAGRAPFVDNPYKPEGNLASLYGEDARGKWTLRITNDGKPAHLNCLTLDISRAVPQSFTSRRGGIAATVTFTERNFIYDTSRLTIRRSGRTAFDAPIASIPGCRDCSGSRPVDVKVVDLDGGAPEVLLDLYTGGAHCCTVSLIMRWDPKAHRYRPTFVSWGNYGRRVADLDHDGKPEFVAFDERFLYEYSAYVFSSAPIRIWSYRAGRLVDVTRKFPAQIRRNAAINLGYYKKGRKEIRNTDVRSYVAAYVADQYLLGDRAAAQRLLRVALQRGDLGRGKDLLGLPAGAAFVKVLMRDLQKWGYIRTS